jgi:hypothetical protein
MADEQQAKPSFKHAVVTKALAPVVATVATAVASYLLRKGMELWQETVQPKLDERGGAEAVVREASDKVGSAVSDATPDEPEASDEDRDDERKKREQRRQQRRRKLEQAGSS